MISNCVTVQQSIKSYIGHVRNLTKFITLRVVMRFYLFSCFAVSSFAIG